jgi:nitrogen fixation protein FixH
LCINTALTSITHATTGATGIGTATGLPAGVTASWAADVITISGTPTESGTFNYSIPLSGGCGSVNATGTITVTPDNTAGAASYTPTLCINTSLTALSHATTTATGIGTATGLPAGVTASWAGDVITISGIPMESGTFSYTIPLTGGCNTVEATGTINVTPDNTVGAASAMPTLCINTALTDITHATNGASGIGTPTGLPAGVTASWASDKVTISGTPSESGTFSYTIPLSGGCGSVDATGTITVTPDNTAGAGSATPTLCINTALTDITHSTTIATGIGMASGLPAGLTASWEADVITITGTPSESGTFNYTIPLSGGCGSAEATGTITVTPANTAGAASASPSVCINAALTAVTLITTGATGIGTPTGLPAGVTASWAADIITVSGTPTESGIFNYSIPLTGGCGSAEAKGTITVKAAPNATITVADESGLTDDDGTICVGASAILTAAGGSSYSWGSESNAIYVVNPGTTANYSVTVTASNGCSAVAMTTINVNTLPVPTANTTNPDCPMAQTGSATATSNPAWTYLWSNGATTAAVTGLVQGLYTLTVTDDKGCEGTTSATLTDPFDIDIVIDKTDVTCFGDSSGAITLMVTGGTTPYSYSWSANANAGDTDTVTGLAAGNYSVTVTESGANACQAVSSIDIDQPEYGIKVVISVSENSDLLADDGTICQDDFATLTVNAVATPGASIDAFAWDDVTGSTSSILSVGEAGTYTVTVTDSYGCSTTQSSVVVVTPTNTAGEASAMPTLCINNTLTDITHATTGATGIGTATGLPAGITASWAADVITISGTPTESGTFNYSIPLTGGCGSVNATGTITVDPDNTVGVASASPTICINAPLTAFTHATTGATGIGTATGLPAGVTATWASNTITISGTPTESGTFDYDVPLTGGCANISATGTITVLADTKDPVITCPSDQIVNPAANSCNVILPDYTSSSFTTATDSCASSPTITQSPMSYTLSGHNSSVTVTMTADDGNGNTATCSFKVTLVDTTAPLATCQDVTVYLDAMGNGSTTAMAVNNGSSDSCGIASLVLNDSTFNCSDIGPTGVTAGNTVTLSVTDENGNTATCTAEVMVLDTVKPVATCQDVTVYLDAMGKGGTTATAIDNASTDACGIASLVLNDSTFNCNDVDADNVAPGNTVTLTVTDDNGNTATCTAAVTVLDTIKPVAICQDVTVYLDAMGKGSTTATAVDNSSTDACGIAGLVLNDSTFNCSDVGGATLAPGNTVTLTVADVNGNTATCTADVTVLDTIKPVATCQDVTVYLDASGSGIANATAVDNASADACGIAGLVLSDSTFSCSEVDLAGATGNTVTLTVTDANGNTATCTADVTVLDTVKPAAICQDVTVYLDAMGNGSTTATAVDNASKDACGIASLILNDSTFNCNDVGGTDVAAGNTVTLTVIDINGNMSTCTADVTVLDTIKPTPNCQDLTVYLDAMGKGSITATAVDKSSTDICGIASLVLNDSTFNCNDVGAMVAAGNTVTLTVTDPSGNTSTCTAGVTVLDTIKPVAHCKNVTVNLDVTGNGSTTAAAVDDNSSDNCSIANRSLSDTNFNPSDVGPNTVTLTVTDPSGNTSSCSATVTVEDDAVPDAKCQNITRILNTLGNRIVTVAEVNNGSSDASGIASLVLSQTSFNCSNLGPNLVTLTVTDVNSNSSSCTATIIILDKTPPKAFCKNASVVLDAAGSAMLPASAVNNGSTDACGVSSLSLSQSAFTCAHVGENTVVLTVADASGNAKTCSAIVTVTDVTTPVALCKPAAAMLDANGMVTVSASAVNDNSTDACGIGLLSLSPSSFSCAHIGINPVTLTVTDENGNTSSCSSTISVSEQVLPKAKCKNTTAYLDANGQVIIMPSMVNNSSSDNCGIATMSLSKTTFDCSNLGANAVTLTVTDASGNSMSCNGTVLVADNLPPTLVCKDITLPVLGGTTLQPSQVYDAAASGDNCGTITPLIVTPSVFYCANAGPNAVTLTVNDGHGNTATCQATVTVQGPAIAAVSTPENCNQLNGTIVVTVQDFMGQPAYSINNGVNYQLVNTFNNLEAGLYPVVVTFLGSDNCTTPPIYVEVAENAETNTWTGLGDGINWTNPLNWSLLLVPVDCHHVVIPPGHTVLMKQAEVANGRTLDVKVGSTLTVQPGAVLNIYQ